MAVFADTLTVPAGATEIEPARLDLIVQPGNLRRVRIYVPPGPRGEVSLRVLHSGVQLLPARTGTWISPDNDTIDWAMDEPYPIGDGDAIITLEAKSPNANYKHTFQFEATVTTAATSSTSGTSITNRILDAFSPKGN